MIKVDLKKIFYMDYLIHIRKTGTAAEFATKVGVARSTFFEYMDYMRNELNIVILYDRSAKTYYYSNKGLYDSLKQETVIQTVSIPNKPDSLKFYFRINI